TGSRRYAPAGRRDRSGPPIRARNADRPRAVAAIVRRSRIRDAARRAVPGRLRTRRYRHQWAGRSGDEPVVRPIVRRRGQVLRRPGASINETADDAVVLRVIAGLVGLLMLLGYLAVRPHAQF